MSNSEENQVYKLVIDTNLLIAAFFNKKSHSFKLLDLVKKDKVKLLWTEPIKNESKLILRNICKSLKSSFDQEKTLNQLFKSENKIKNPPKVNIVKQDPEDNKFLSCAIAGKADLIISNDKHLLDLKEFKNIPILTSSKAFKKICS